MSLRFNIGWIPSALGIAAYALCLPVLSSFYFFDWFVVRWAVHGSVFLAALVSAVCPFVLPKLGLGSQLRLEISVSLMELTFAICDLHLLESGPVWPIIAGVMPVPFKLQKFQASELSMTLRPWRRCIFLNSIGLDLGLSLMDPKDFDQEVAEAAAVSAANSEIESRFAALKENEIANIPETPPNDSVTKLIDAIIDSVSVGSETFRFCLTSYNENKTPAMIGLSVKELNLPTAVEVSGAVPRRWARNVRTDGLAIGVRPAGKSPDLEVYSIDCVLMAAMDSVLTLTAPPVMAGLLSGHRRSVRRIEASVVVDGNSSIYLEKTATGAILGVLGQLSSASAWQAKFADVDIRNRRCVTDFAQREALVLQMREALKGKNAPVELAKLHNGIRCADALVLRWWAAKDDAKAFAFDLRDEMNWSSHADEFWSTATEVRTNIGKEKSLFHELAVKLQIAQSNLYVNSAGSRAAAILSGGLVISCDLLPGGTEVGLSIMTETKIEARGEKEGGLLTLIHSGKLDGEIAPVFGVGLKLPASAPMDVNLTSSNSRILVHYPAMLNTFLPAVLGLLESDPVPEPPEAPESCANAAQSVDIAKEEGDKSPSILGGMLLDVKIIAERSELFLATHSKGDEIRLLLDDGTKCSPKGVVAKAASCQIVLHSGEAGENVTLELRGAGVDVLYGKNGKNALHGMVDQLIQSMECVEIVYELALNEHGCTTNVGLTFPFADMLVSPKVVRHGTASMKVLMDSLATPSEEPAQGDTENSAAHEENASEVNKTKPQNITATSADCKDTDSERIFAVRKRLKDLFDDVDNDGSGELDRNEIKLLLDRLCSVGQFTLMRTELDSEFESLWAVADFSQDGKISFDEFCQFVVAYCGGLGSTGSRANSTKGSLQLAVGDLCCMHGKYGDHITKFLTSTGRNNAQDLDLALEIEDPNHAASILRRIAIAVVLSRTASMQEFCLAFSTRLHSSDLKQICSQLNTTISDADVETVLKHLNDIEGGGNASPGDVAKDRFTEAIDRKIEAFLALEEYYCVPRNFKGDSLAQDLKLETIDTADIEKCLQPETVLQLQWTLLRMLQNWEVAKKWWEVSVGPRLACDAKWGVRENAVYRHASEVMRDALSGHFQTKVADISRNDRVKIDSSAVPRSVYNLSIKAAGFDVAFSDVLSQLKDTPRLRIKAESPTPQASAFSLDIRYGHCPDGEYLSVNDTITGRLNLQGFYATCMRAHSAVAETDDEIRYNEHFIEKWGIQAFVSSVEGEAATTINFVTDQHFTMNFTSSLMLAIQPLMASLKPPENEEKQDTLQQSMCASPLDHFLRSLPLNEKIENVRNKLQNLNLIRDLPRGGEQIGLAETMEEKHIEVQHSPTIVGIVPIHKVITRICTSPGWRVKCLVLNDGNLRVEAQETGARQADPVLTVYTRSRSLRPPLTFDNSKSSLATSMRQEFKRQMNILNLCGLPGSFTFRQVQRVDVKDRGLTKVDATWWPSNTSIEGNWTGGTIVGASVWWNNDGTQSIINMTTPTEFFVEFAWGNVTCALKEDGKLHWSNGDVWKKAELVALEWCEIDAAQIPRGADSVEKAWYGKADALWGYEGREVTKKVKELLRANRPLQASNDNFGDPVHGIRKALAIQLKVSSGSDLVLEIFKDEASREQKTSRPDFVMHGAQPLTLKPDFVTFGRQGYDLPEGVAGEALWKRISDEGRLCLCTDLMVENQAAVLQLLPPIELRNATLHPQVIELLEPAADSLQVRQREYVLPGQSFQIPLSAKMGWVVRTYGEVSHSFTLFPDLFLHKGAKARESTTLRRNLGLSLEAHSIKQRQYEESQGASNSIIVTRASSLIHSYSSHHIGSHFARKSSDKLHRYTLLLLPSMRITNALPFTLICTLRRYGSGNGAQVVEDCVEEARKMKPGSTMDFGLSSSGFQVTFRLENASEAMFFEALDDVLAECKFDFRKDELNSMKAFNEAAKKWQTMHFTFTSPRGQSYMQDFGTSSATSVSCSLQCDWTKGFGPEFRVYSQHLVFNKTAFPIQVRPHKTNERASEVHVESEKQIGLIKCADKVHDLEVQVLQPTVKRSQEEPLEFRGPLSFRCWHDEVTEWISCTASIERAGVFEGSWTGGTIVGNTLRWQDGTKDAIDVIRSNQFTIYEKSLTAELKDDGKLHWSNGDVWEKAALVALETFAIDAALIPHGADSVEKAWYGKADALWGNEGRDATKKVKELLRAHRPLQASNDNFGDPVYGVKKSLAIQLKPSAQAWVMALSGSVHKRWPLSEFSTASHADAITSSEDDVICLADPHNSHKLLLKAESSDVVRDWLQHINAVIDALIQNATFMPDDWGSDGGVYRKCRIPEVHGKCWSKPLPVEAPGEGQVSIDVSDLDSHAMLFLGIQVKPMLGVLHRSTAVTFTPRYVVQNRTSDYVQVCPCILPPERSHTFTIFGRHADITPPAHAAMVRAREVAKAAPTFGTLTHHLAETHATWVPPGESVVLYHFPASFSGDLVSGRNAVSLRLSGPPTLEVIKMGDERPQRLDKVGTDFMPYNDEHSYISFLPKTLLGAAESGRLRCLVAAYKPGQLAGKFVLTVAADVVVAVQAEAETPPMLATYPWHNIGGSFEDQLRLKHRVNSSWHTLNFKLFHAQMSAGLVEFDGLGAGSMIFFISSAPGGLEDNIDEPSDLPWSEWMDLESTRDELRTLRIPDGDISGNDMRMVNCSLQVIHSSAFLVLSDVAAPYKIQNWSSSRTLAVEFEGNSTRHVLPPLKWWSFVWPESHAKYRRLFVQDVETGRRQMYNIDSHNGPQQHFLLSAEFDDDHKGETAPLTEKGYYSIVSLNEPSEMKVFLKRVCGDINSSARMPSDASITQFYSQYRSHKKSKTLENVRNQLIQERLVPCPKSEFSEAGFERATLCTATMANFIAEFLASAGLAAEGDYEVEKFASHCRKNSTVERAIEQLIQKPWVRCERDAEDFYKTARKKHNYLTLRLCLWRIALDDTKSPKASYSTAIDEVMKELVEGRHPARDWEATKLAVQKRRSESIVVEGQRLSPIAEDAEEVGQVLAELEVEVLRIEDMAGSQYKFGDLLKRATGNKSLKPRIRIEYNGEQKMTRSYEAQDGRRTEIGERFRFPLPGHVEEVHLSLNVVHESSSALRDGALIGEATVSLARDALVLRDERPVPLLRNGEQSGILVLRISSLVDVNEFLGRRGTLESSLGTGSQIGEELSREISSGVSSGRRARLDTDNQSESGIALAQRQIAASVQLDEEGYNQICGHRSKPIFVAFVRRKLRSDGKEVLNGSRLKTFCVEFRSREDHSWDALLKELENQDWIQEHVDMGTARLLTYRSQEGMTKVLSFTDGVPAKDDEADQEDEASRFVARNRHFANSEEQGKLMIGNIVFANLDIDVQFAGLHLCLMYDPEVHASGTGKTYKPENLHCRQEQFILTADHFRFRKKADEDGLKITLHNFQIDNMRKADAHEPIILAPFDSGFQIHRREKNPGEKYRRLTPFLSLEIELSQSEIIHIETFNFLLGAVQIRIDASYWMTIGGYILDWAGQWSTSSNRNAEEAVVEYLAELNDSTEVPTSSSNKTYLYLETFHIGAIVSHLEFLMPSKNTSTEEKAGVDDDFTDAEIATESSSASVFNLLYGSKKNTGPLKLLLTPLLNGLGVILKSVGSGVLSGVGHITPKIVLSNLVFKEEFGELDLIVTKIVRHYILAGSTQAYKFLFSTNILGDPIGLGSSVTGGFCQFLRKTKNEITTGDIRGEGVAELVDGVVGGFAGWTGKFIGAVGDTVDAVAQQGQSGHNQHIDNAKDGVLAGALTVGRGVGDGLKGLVMKPIEGWHEKGAAGLGRGLLQGSVGVLAKPVSGILHGTQCIVEGIEAQTHALTKKEDIRPRRRPRKLDGDEAFNPLTGLELMPKLSVFVERLELRCVDEREGSSYNIMLKSHTAKETNVGHIKKYGVVFKEVHWFTMDKFLEHGLHFVVKDRTLEDVQSHAGFDPTELFITASAHETTSTPFDAGRKQEFEDAGGVVFKQDLKKHVIARIQNLILNPPVEDIEKRRRPTEPLRLLVWPTEMRNRMFPRSRPLELKLRFFPGWDPEAVPYNQRYEETQEYYDQELPDEASNRSKAEGFLEKKTTGPFNVWSAKWVLIEDGKFKYWEDKRHYDHKEPPKVVYPLCHQESLHSGGYRAEGYCFAMGPDRQEYFVQVSRKTREIQAKWRMPRHGRVDPHHPQTIDAWMETIYKHTVPSGNS